MTAGNAPPVNDGAAALVVMSERRARRTELTPMARIVGQATSGLAPKYVLMTPVEAVRRVVEEGRLVTRRCRSVRDQRGVLGSGRSPCFASWGSIRRGSTSTAAPSRSDIRSAPAAPRILTTLLYALQQRKLKRGIATLCLGGGNGVAHRALYEPALK